MSICNCEIPFQTLDQAIILEGGQQEHPIPGLPECGVSSGFMEQCTTTVLPITGKAGFGQDWILESSPMSETFTGWPPGTILDLSRTL